MYLLTTSSIMLCIICSYYIAISFITTYSQYLAISTYIYTGLSTGAIVGIVTGCLLILGFVIISYTTLLAKYTRKRER